MRTVALAVETLLDSDQLTKDEVTVTPIIDNNSEDISTEKELEDKETNVEESNELETEVNETGNEDDQSRKRRKILKIEKTKPNTFNQGSHYANHWQDGRWF